MRHLRELLEAATPDIAAVSSHLDSVEPRQRVAEIRTLGRLHLSRLFDASSGFRQISLSDLVSEKLSPMQEVVHHGKNSLPFFNNFSKVFTRPAAAAPPELWGYNRAGAFVETVVGPGYFVAYPSEVEGEILVDYRRVPSARPAHWPEVLPNSARLSKWVYDSTEDILRGVSKHVTVGRATRAGKPMSAWFVLSRDDEL